MPYIKKDKRPELDSLIQPLIEHLGSFDIEKQDGAVAYTFTKILKSLYKDKYFNYNRAMGVLSGVNAEFYRRYIATYEDKKIEENGDL